MPIMSSQETGTKRKAHQPASQATSNKGPSREEAFDKAFYTDTSSDDETDSVRGQLTKRGQLKKKRGRKPKRPKTTPAETSALSDCEIEMEDVAPGEDRSINMKLLQKLVNDPRGSKLKTELMNLLIHSRLPLGSALQTAALPTPTPTPNTNIITGSNTTRGNLVTTPTRIITLKDLPDEILTKIYRNVLVDPSRPVFFTTRRDLERSSQFLRTCRKIYLKGSFFLYGENSFHFRRARDNRGTYFEKTWKEIGYKDVRRFFHDIGPHNIAKLRYISFEFEDALPTMTPYLTNEERKYVNDLALIEALNMIAKYSKLEKLAINFGGSRSVTSRDYHFLKAVCTIRCHELVSYNISGVAKISAQVYEMVKSLAEIAADDNIDRSKKKLVPRMYQDAVPW